MDIKFHSQHMELAHIRFKGIMEKVLIFSLAFQLNCNTFSCQGLYIRLTSLLSKIDIKFKWLEMKMMKHYLCIHDSTIYQ